MSRSFTVGEETTHLIGDRACPDCWEGFPAPCSCGGLVHAAGEAQGPRGAEEPAITRCDRCGRAEDEIE